MTFCLWGILASKLDQRMRVRNLQEGNMGGNDKLKWLNVNRLLR